ncbi:hypothetical protein [Criblamydia sequanensis]|uniref:Uncharacterized protein n=1 Tax=Candidatus Criblamydia sequanensis CRIB-18 TaxID=1437425 RepID=A0A090D159_9BACT|nr:hypothetical protein [Criblamydia sequanensis]CDR33640.1 hypothetical protein CSEC_0811 [Criblamydia sequanensis CRIB-18]
MNISPGSLYKTEILTIPKTELEKEIRKSESLGGYVKKGNLDSTKENYVLEVTTPLTEITCDEEELGPLESVLAISKFQVNEIVKNKDSTLTLKVKRISTSELRRQREQNSNSQTLGRASSCHHLKTKTLKERRKSEEIEPSTLEQKKEHKNFKSILSKLLPKQAK